MKKIYSWEKCFVSKTSIYLSLGLYKDVQVTKEAFISQKRISSTSKPELSYFFFLLRVILPSWIRIPNTDPDPNPLT
jgi:hypothetical protein